MVDYANTENKFIGTPYPVVKTARGFFQKTRSTDSIKADLLALLLTNPGERVMLPTYGTALNSMIFEPNDRLAAEQTRELIINAINTWEPRITVEDIEITNSGDINLLNSLDTLDEQERIMTVKIKFIDPENIAAVQELVLEVPLAGF